MSTLKVDAIRHNSATSDAITTASDGTCTARITGMTGGSGLSHRNIIVNGGMKVAQRSVSEAITGYGYHTVDRFHTVANSSMSYAVTMSQENDNPDGNGKSVKLLTTTASTPTGSENYILRYTGEEQDISGAGLGTSSCKQLTISFSVKTNKTGTHGFQIYIGNNQPNMTVAYTVSSANTWERKTITFPTYTSSYSHLSDNAKGFMIDWNLASGPSDIMAPYNWATGSTAARGVTGQVNMLDTVGNYFQLTNVQLEIGDTATTFEHRSFGEEEDRCMRYYEEGSFSFRASGNIVRYCQAFNKRKRANPTMKVYYDSSKATDGTINSGNSNNSGWSRNPTGKNAFNIEKNTGSNGNGVDFAGYYTAESEL